MDADGNVVFVRLFDNGAIERRRERLFGSTSVVHPNLYKFGLHEHVILHGFARLFERADRIGNINS